MIYQSYETNFEFIRLARLFQPIEMKSFCINNKLKKTFDAFSVLLIRKNSQTFIFHFYKRGQKRTDHLSGAGLQNMNNRNQLLFLCFLLPLSTSLLSVEWWCKINWNFCGDHNIQTKCERELLTHWRWVCKRIVINRDISENIFFQKTYLYAVS